MNKLSKILLITVTIFLINNHFIFARKIVSEDILRINSKIMEYEERKLEIEIRLLKLKIRGIERTQNELFLFQQTIPDERSILLEILEKLSKYSVESPNSPKVAQMRLILERNMDRLCGTYSCEVFFKICEPRIETLRKYGIVFASED